MNTLKKLTITAAAAFPAVAMFAGVANAAPVDHVVNGHFSSNASGWFPGDGASIKRHDGYPFGAVTNAKVGAGASSVLATQCVNIYSGLPAAFEGRTFIPANQERGGSAGFIITLYADPDCSGAQVGQAGNPMFDIQEEVWKQHSFNLPMKSAPRSARIALAVTKAKSEANPNAPFMAFFDDIKLIQHPLEAADADDNPPEQPEPDNEPVLPDEKPVDEPESPVEEDEPAEQPGDEPVGEPADEPAEEDPAPQQPGDEPQQPEPSGDTQNPAPQDNAGGAGSGAGAPLAPATGSSAPLPGIESAQGAAAPGGTTGRDRPVDGDTPAPLAQYPAPANDLIGADELGIFGGVIAAFGLVLAGLAVRRQRSN